MALLCSAAVRAHEIGTTRVSVLFREGRMYDVEIVTDASALAEKLEAFAGRSTPPDTRPARLQSLLTGSDGTFRQRVKVAFDGSEVRPAIAYSVAPGIDAASAAVATIRLSGQIPPDARHFTWTYAWTFASYAMTVRSARSENLATQWLEGGQQSRALSCEPPSRMRVAAWYGARAYTHMRVNGFEYLVIVLGMVPFSRRLRSIVWRPTGPEHALVNDDWASHDIGVLWPAAGADE
jgi:hypothetical protein